MLGLFYGLAVILIGAAGFAAGAGVIFALGLLAFAAHLVWQIVRLDISDPDRCLALFKSDRDAGLILFAGCCSTRLCLVWFETLALLRRQTAVDGERLADNKRSIVGSEEQHRASDFFRLGDASDRMPGENELLDLRGPETSPPRCGFVSPPGRRR